MQKKKKKKKKKERYFCQFSMVDLMVGLVVFTPQNY